MALKGSKTEQSLKDAFAGESQANRRYLYFAAKADVEGYNDVSTVFRSTAEGETGHAHGHLEYLEESGDPATGLPIGATSDNLKAAIDRASLLGADILIGGIYQAHKYFTGSGATEQEWNWSAQYLRTVGEYGQQVGVRLGLEVLNRFEVFLINTSADCKRMVEQVGLDNVGVHYDTHHANIEEPDPRQALANVADVLNHVHLSESHRGTLGTGQVDWNASFSALKDINYQGWLVLEAFGTVDPELALAANVWRNAFATPEEVYLEGINFIRERI